MLVLEILFWVLLFLVVYPFALYQPLLGLLVRGMRKTKLNSYEKKWPHVTIVISAYNEEAIIAKKLDNTRSLHYPEGHLEIIVVSDASSDGTDALVREKAEIDKRIRLVRQDERKGKTAGLNLALEAAGGEIVVFSDANAMYQRDALYELVKFFINPQVGYVVGAARYNQDETDTDKDCESTYWDQELSLKQIESDFFSVVGGDGAIYAIRRSLYRPLQEDDINDFVNPIQIIARGYRGVFNANAVCYEDTAQDLAKEFRRKRRIVNRTFRALTRYVGEFSLTRHYKFLFMLVSHKVLRWFGMFNIIGLSLISLILGVSGEGLIYGACLLGILLSGSFALVGWPLSLFSNCPKMFSLLYYFYMVNIAAMLGIIDNFRGRYHVTWDHVRKD